MTQIFFVSGAPKSGTTWVQRLLDAHPEVVCSGEGHFVTELVGPLLKLKAQYNKKLELVAERVYEHKPYYPLMVDADVGAAAVTLILRQMGKRATPGAKAVGDKTPRYTDGFGILGGLFPAARFIHVVRHPGDVAVSLLHHALRVGREDALTFGSPGHLETATTAATAWRAAQANATAFAKANPDRLLKVRYEDLTAEPVTAARPMFAFLGAGDDDDVVAAAVAEADFEKLSGRKAGEENPRSFFRKGVAGDWRGRLSDDALAVVAETCGPLMEAENYLQ